MSHYVGLDVSVKSVSICVVDAQGAILAVIAIGITGLILPGMIDEPG